MTVMFVEDTTSAITSVGPFFSAGGVVGASILNTSTYNVCTLIHAYIYIYIYIYIRNISLHAHDNYSYT